MRGQFLSPSSELLQAESWAGEIRVNRIRLTAIMLLYGQHLLDHFLWRPGRLEPAYAVRVTVLAVSGTVVAASLYYVLRRGWLHPSLKYIASLWGVFMIAVVLAMTEQTRGPLAMLLLLPIAAATLRLSLPLVYFNSLASAMAYLALVANYAWWEIGWDRYYGDQTLRIPRWEQVAVLLSMMTAGLLAGQNVRQSLRILRAASFEGDGP